MKRIVLGLVLVYLVSGTAEADLNLQIRDDFTPVTPADYPFVYPFTGTMEPGDWQMICAESCSANAETCAAGQTNFGSTAHAVCGSHHTGEDWLVRSRSSLTGDVPIRSINHGVVVFAGQHGPETGYLVIVKHIAPPERPFVFPAYPYGNCGRVQGQGSVVYSYYLHLDRDLPVKVGDQVYKGQIIGITYNLHDVTKNVNCPGGKGSPYTYCPHLHFELWSSVRAASGDQNNDSDGYDAQGCGGAGTFGHSLAKLLRPEAFIQANSNGPLIKNIVGLTGGDLAIQGSGFGAASSGGVAVEVMSCFDGLRTFVPAATDWQDPSIRLRGTLLDSTSNQPLSKLRPPLKVRIVAAGGALSNEKYFPFTDVLCDWRTDGIIGLWGTNVIKGKDPAICSESRAGGCSFAPEESAKRADLLTMLVRARNAECSTSNPCPQTLPFGDVSAEDWYFDSVRAAYREGWIKAGSTFRPRDNVNRAEAVALLSGAFEMHPDDFNCVSFADVLDETAWFYDPLCAMSGRGIVEGYREGYRCDGTSAARPTDRYFCPERSLSRSEAAALIWRSQEFERKEKGN